MTVRVEKYEQKNGVVRTVFVTDGFARLTVVTQPDEFPSITTDGTWLVSRKDIDEMIGILTAVRSML